MPTQDCLWDASGNFIIDPYDSGHTRFYNSEGGFVFNHFLHSRDRDNSGWWIEMVPQSDHARLHTSAARFVLRDGSNNDISIYPNENGHPRFKAGENQEWIFHGRNITAYRGSQWAILEPNVDGFTKVHTNDSGFRFIDRSNDYLQIRPSVSSRVEFSTPKDGYTFKNATREWFLLNRSDDIIFAQPEANKVPWRFADHDLRVDKDIFARGSQINSDRRLKKNIQELDRDEAVLDRVSKLRPVRFHWRDQDDEAEKTVGFIAQEVETLFPDAIAHNGDRLAISTSELAAYTIAGLQEHKAASDARLAGLEEENGRLKEQLSRLAQRLESLESAIR